MDEAASIWARLTADLNGDGEFTIADVGPSLLRILVLPGDALLSLLLTYAPETAEFLELGTDDYGGVVSICASILIWLAALFVAGAIVSALRALDRRLTAWLVGLSAEIARRFRVMRRLLVTSIGLRSWRKANVANSLSVASVRLASDETTVLRCLSGIEDGAVLTIDELAARIGCSKRSIIPVLRHLTDLGLVEHSADTVTQRQGHRIGVAGQMYLLGA